MLNGNGRWVGLAVLLGIVMIASGIILVNFIAHNQICSLSRARPIINPWETPLVLSKDMQSLARIAGYFVLDNRLNPELRYLPLGDLEEVSFKATERGQVFELRTQCGHLALIMQQRNTRLDCIRMFAMTGLEASQCLIEEPEIGADLGKHYYCMETRDYLCSGSLGGWRNLTIETLVITYIEFVVDQGADESGAPRTPRDFCPNAIHPVQNYNMTS